MALMDCPECQEKISEHAEACPICGFPLKKHLDKQEHFGLQEEESEESQDIPLREGVNYGVSSSKPKDTHHEAGCVFSIISFGFFLIWLALTIVIPNKMTYFSIALFLVSGFYLRNPSFFSQTPDPRHKHMSFIFSIYFLISALFGIAILYFKIKVPLPF